MTEIIYKCDRCGKHYENSNKPQKYGIYLPVDGKRSFYPNFLDLCPSCLDELENFMKFVSKGE